MRYYPIFLDITKAKCLIVGAGSVGLRKLDTLLECNVAQVLIVDPTEPSIKLKEQLHNSKIIFVQRGFELSDVLNCKIVFAATSNKELNARIASICAEHSILCNCIDNAEAGDFILPAIAKHGQITAAISTEGASPAYAKKLKTDLSKWLENYSPLAEFLGRLRPIVLANNSDSAENAVLFRALVNSDLQNALIEKNKNSCIEILQKKLPKNMQQNIEELLDGLA